MTIQGAIAELQNLLGADDIPLCYKPAIEKVIETIMDALEGVCFDEWCDDCKEYDAEKNCCPRFNKVIREALKREPSDDLISRADAIEALGEEPPVWCDEEYEIAERNQWRDDVEAIKSVPSADRPRDGDLISRQAAIDALYDKGSSMTAWGELLAMKWSDIQKCIEQLPSADRPRGEWICKEELIDAIKDAEFVYDGDEDGHKEHDISEMVRVIFKDIIDNLPSADMRGDNK